VDCDVYTDRKALVVHRNAPLTETGRLRLARCVVEDGWPLRRAAERFQVSPTTAQRWAGRYRALGEAGTADRSSRPPVLVRILRDHIACFGVAPDGRIFQNTAGNYIDTSAYNITWNRAREAALTVDEHTLNLAKRPYDLRHAGISFWLASGVDPAECARRAGQSIQVLFRYYAKFLAETRDHANQLIEHSMNRWEATRMPSQAQTGPEIFRTSRAGRG